MPKRRGAAGQTIAQREWQAEKDPLFVNESSGSVVNLGQKAIPPGHITSLTPAELANPAVQRFIRRGILRRVRYQRATIRMVDGRPRILVVVHTMFPGGAEIATLELHKALRARGFDQMMVLMYSGDRTHHTMLSEAAEQIFDIYEEHNPGNEIERCAIVQEASNKFRPDIVLYSLLLHVPKSYETMDGRPPIIQMMHSELSDTMAGYHRACTDAVVTVSRAMARNVARKLNIPTDNIYPIWNGIDPARVRGGRSLRKELRIPDEATIAGVVGPMSDIKRPLIALEAFASVSSNGHLIFVGNPGDLGQEVQRRAAMLNVSDRVHILGVRGDMGNIYATFDMLLSCSMTEGLPMSMIEAMFCRLPILATAVGGTPELVRHGENGFLYQMDDYRSLRKYLSQLMKEKQLRAKMGTMGYKRAHKDFDINRSTDAFVKLLDKFLIREQNLRCSIVIPVYNSQATLGRALWSIREQTMPYFEIIAVNDGSTDMSTTILLQHSRADKRIKVLNQPHLGIVSALNMGIKAARTPIIVRMDADDEMIHNRLELQLEYMVNHADVDVCGGQFMARDKHGNNLGYGNRLPTTHEEIIATMAFSNPMAHPTVAFYKKAWEKAGGYKGEGKAEDYQLWTDMAVAGCQFANMDEPLLIYTHTHEGEPEYAAWRDSSLAGIRSHFIRRMEAKANGR